MREMTYKGWYVHLTRPMSRIRDDFPHGFFPRRSHYKSEAMRLGMEVIDKGGKVEIMRTNTCAASCHCSKRDQREEV